MAQTKYIDLLTDFSFKKVFGTEPNKDLLISFLNEVFKGRKKIVNLTYNKNEHHGENKDEGSAVFDLLCTGEHGEVFLIEVQHSKPVNFKKRGLFYTSRLISEQAPKGEMKAWKYNISEVYFVAILEKSDEFDTGDNRYLHDVCLCYRDTGEIFYNGLGYTYINLSKFVKEKHELTENLDQWLHSLKHMEEQDQMPPHLKATIFEKLYKIAEYTNLSKEEQRMYNQDLKRKWDNEAVIAYREEKGIAKGIEQGELKAKLEIAKNLKQTSLPIEEIAKATGLSIEEIEKL